MKDMYNREVGMSSARNSALTEEGVFIEEGL